MPGSALSFARAAPTESKYKIHSPKVTELLEEYLKSGKAPLHRYQIEAVLKTKGRILADEADRLAKLMAKGEDTIAKPVLIVAPMGSGKSGMIVLLPYVLSSKKVLVLTPSKVISEQLRVEFGDDSKKKCFSETVGMVSEDIDEKKDELDSLLEDVKMIEGPLDLNKRSGNLYIVNAQKFGGKSRLSLSLDYRNEKLIPDVEAFFKNFDTLIVDEAHHFPAPTWENIVREFTKPVPGLAKKIIFLTATPYKIIDGKEQFILGSGKEAKSRIAYEITPQKLQRLTTRPCEFQEPYHAYDEKNVLKDILQIFESNVQTEPRITKPKAMILVRLKEEANKLVRYMDKEMKKEDFAIAVLSDKPDALEKFSQEDYQVAVTCGVGKEGYDNPDVIACVILRKITKGRILFNQFMGRCMRLNRRLEGDNPDQTVGTVLSYKEFAQGKLFEESDKLAEDHPLEVDDEDDVGTKRSCAAKAKGSRSTKRRKAS